MNEISQNETKNCPSRLTAVEVWGIPANDTVLKRELQGCSREIVRCGGKGGGGGRREMGT